MTHTQQLPSWRETPSRSAIVDFVNTVTDASGDGYVPVEERIAVFDNDGTLWCEQPLVQGVFILGRLAEFATQDVSLRARQPYKAAFEGDTSWFQQAVFKHYQGDDGDVALLEAAALEAFAGLRVEEFGGAVQNFFETARHPKYGRPFTDLGYAPMIELLEYLRSNEFSTYIVTGGGRDFVRPIAGDMYGVPMESVVGSAPEMTFEAGDTDSHIVRRSGLDIFSEGPGKPLQIWDRTGRRPLVAVGNANGDIPMLEFAASNSLPSLCLVVHHDDADREFAYDQGAEVVHSAAHLRGWTIASMRDDWERVFSF